MHDKFKDNKINIEILNANIRSTPKEIVSFAEGTYFTQLVETASQIAKAKEKQILLLAGPSASSKTTTANKLREILLRKGINSVVLSLDDFYIDRELLPYLPNGEIDYESIHTLDLEKLKTCFTELIKNGESEFPLFDFHTGKRSNETRLVKMDANTKVIIEGLHALNPMLISDIDSSSFYKLYISPNSDYYADNQIVLPARDVRLVRRVIRDHFHRSSTISNTLKMWVNVITAEVSYILPFKNEADFLIDSTVIYEPNIYAPFFSYLVEKEEIPPIFQPEVSRICHAIKCFDMLDIAFLPKGTVIREFLE